MPIPELSIAMPYWCRQREIDRSLAAYRRLYADRGLEISICDDGSPVPVNAPGCVVTTLPRKKHGMNPCVPMNIAVRASHADIIVLTNPEIEHRDDVLGAMLGLIDEHSYVAATCYDVDGEMLAGPGKRYERRLPEGAHFHFCAMLTRQLFERAGGFDERYRNGRGFEDADFLWRLRQAGARFKSCARTVWHYRTHHAYIETTSNAALYDATWPQ